MDSCKKFAKTKPVILVIITFVLVFGLVRVINLIPKFPMSGAIQEILLAAIIFVFTFIFMGKEKVSFKGAGFRYAFRFVRGYLILMGVIGVLLIAMALLSALFSEEGGSLSEIPVSLLQALIMGLLVGIAEEFSFRGLIFGGLLQKSGNSKKSIITAAIVSGLLFGVMHVLGSVIDGEITGLMALLTALLKTLQTGIFGVVLAFIYYKTRNIYAIAAIHGLDDLILFIAAAIMPKGGRLGSYVAAGDGAGRIAIVYVIFTVVMIPLLVKCIKTVKESEAIPFDDDFLPRAVVYEKKAKKNNKK